jgi:hypothetical protein
MMINKTNKERVLDYLWSIAPEEATNGQIRQAVSISSHQQVYLLTQELKRKGQINGRQEGREWFFYANESPSVQLASPGPVKIGAGVGNRLSPRAFEELARSILSSYFGVPLLEGTIPGVPKRFDFVSEDGRIVGDAKYFTLVQGMRPPPAKFSVIAEHVWLLEKTAVPIPFLVFGNDPEVPRLWLARYGKLIKGVTFFFLGDSGELVKLTR